MRSIRRALFSLLTGWASAEAQAEIARLRKDLDQAKALAEQDARDARWAKEELEHTVALLEAEVEFLTEWRARELTTVRTERKARQAQGIISELPTRSD